VFSRSVSRVVKSVIVFLSLKNELSSSLPTYKLLRNCCVGNCIVLNCVEVANKIRYISKRTLVLASSRDIEVEEYEDVVGYPGSSPVLRRSSSAESVNDETPLQEPIMEVEEEFAPTSRPTLRFTEPQIAEQT